MNDRYTDVFEGDSPQVIQGDEQIIGMDVRTQPERLPPGMAQYLQNMRLDTLAPTVRLGMAKQTNSITPVSPPLIIPFTVGPGATISTANDGVMGSCVFSDPNNSNALYIFVVTQIQVFVFAGATGVVTTIAYPANEIVENIDSVDMFQVGGNVYLLRGDLGFLFGLTSITSSSTTATVTTSAPHSLYSNMYVRVAGANQACYNGDFQITVTGSSTFTYTMTTTGASPATGTITVNRIKLPMVWKGNFANAFVLTTYGVYAQNFYYMPVSNWGLLQQNRVILEYNRNAVIVSQILGPETYDVINGVFTFGQGTADYLIGAAPYQDTQTVIFMRQSVWLMNGMNADVGAVTTQLISNQIGCCSRHSIATCGSNILFLNERGVYKLEPGLELLLRGNQLPLSAPIDAIIRTINYGATNKPWAAYYLNRYYLAIPVNGSTRNNAMIIYNFINEQWESYDTFPNGFYCDEMQVMLNASGVPTLYVMSLEGGLYAYEQNEQDDFAAAAAAPSQYLINGQFKTRRHSFGTAALKRFNRCTTVYDLDSGASFTPTVTLVNPENTRTLPSVSLVSAGQVTRPAQINKRAYAAEILYKNTALRGSILNYSIGAIVQDNKTVQTT
jgi:hypothetical protein